ncbi:cytochrome c oxidase assembly protein [Elongatibacter sediminis]|uniref:Cytochrome c oxidase assembly protein CtaG n=1 Tax=Elongatibacter sediminis TaxID=3119006 RepID=A0AAW9R6C1_9GAMM
MNQNETPSPDDSRAKASGRTNARLVRRLILVAVGMFGFGYAMVPLYTVFCEVTGLQGRGVTVDTAATGVAESDRDVRVRFLATTHSGLPWQFQAGEPYKSVRLGELSETHYIAMNTRDEAITGHATFNVVPPEASLYFVKTECFCFTQQLLDGHESREMPVYFYVQPDLPDHIREITLSYTFYRNDEPDSVAAIPSATPSR